MADAVSNAEKPRGVPFALGNVANPAGRPKGSRNKLGEAFLADLLTDWSEHGPIVIQTVRAEKPDVYLKVVASILPAQLNVKVSEIDELTDEQLARQFLAIATQLAAAGLDLGAGITATIAAQASGDVPTLQ